MNAAKLKEITDLYYSGLNDILKEAKKLAKTGEVHTDWQWIGISQVESLRKLGFTFDMEERNERLVWARIRWDGHGT